MMCSLASDQSWHFFLCFCVLFKLKVLKPDNDNKMDEFMFEYDA